MRKGFIELTRPLNSIFIGIAAVIGVLTVEKFPPISSILLGFSVAWLLASSSMIFNDYCDIKVDKLINVQRPIPRGEVTPKEALQFAILLGILGLIISLFTKPLCSLIAIVFYLIAIFYNMKGKQLGLIGNLMVSLCVAIPFIYGELLISDKVELLPLIMATLAFFANTGREIAKGIADMEGDKLAGWKTLPISIGVRKSAFIAVLFYMITIVLSPLPFLLKLVSPWYLLIALLADTGFLSSSISLLKDPSAGVSKKVKNRIFCWMIVGLMAFIVGIYA